MAINATITGKVSEPRSRTTNSGKPVMSFGIAATPRRRDDNTGEWSDVGEPLWVEISLWEHDAERWAGIIERGSTVAVSAVLALEAYETRAGERREKVVAKGPKVLAVTPPSGTPSQGSHNAGYGAPAAQGNRGYGGGYSSPQTGSYGFDDTAPF